MNEFKRLALIPARGGSKGIVRKNLREVGGRSLLRRAIDIATKSELFDSVCVSTDDHEIAKLSRELGASVPFIRPSFLSEDESRTIDVIKHAINHYLSEGTSFNSLTLLQPTSPFRQLGDLIEAHKIFDSVQCQTLISVQDVTNFHPSTLYRVQSQISGTSFLVENRDKNMDTGRGTIRQEFETQLWRNGSLYIFRPTSLLASSKLLNSPIAAIKMDWIHSINIDSVDDLELAQRISEAFNI